MSLLGKGWGKPINKNNTPQESKLGVPVAQNTETTGINIELSELISSPTKPDMEKEKSDQKAEKVRNEKEEALDKLRNKFEVHSIRFHQKP